jgi:two-component system, sensor histidine kinase and response regulator
VNWSVLRDRLLRAPWVVAALLASALVVLGIALVGGWAYEVVRALLGIAVALLALALFGALANVRARGAADRALRQQRQQLNDLEDRARRLREELDAHTGAETRLQELNHQLAETERFMRLVTDNIPARLAYWDSERRCMFVNRAGYANWDKRREDFIGRTSKEIFGQTFTSANEPYSAAALRGEAQTFERDERLRSGETVVTLMHYEPDIRDGRVVGFFSLATDVTRTRVAERRLREINEQLRQALERAEAASRAKTMFLSNMSHEIRTPMNAILGLTHLLRRGVTDPLQSDRLRKVTDAADYLLRIINDILDLAKIESGRLRLEARDFSLDEMLSRVTALVSEQACDKGLELMVATGQVPDRLHGDSTRLAQALLNLLGNAVKFTARGSVRLNVAVLEHSPPHLRLRFEVQDTGIGIDPAQLDLLFTPFQQADGSTTRRFGGTGLGLAITKHIAELMDGEVGAESTPMGSRFWFSARLMTADGPSDPTPSSAPAQTPNWPGARVLVAEDNHVNQHVAVELLRTVGIAPDVAEDGLQAVQMARATAYDLILMDVQMPGLDGLQATRQLRNGPRALAVPIVAMTADAFAEDRKACLAAGMNDHIAKPIEVSVLHAVLQRWLPVAR